MGRNLNNPLANSGVAQVSIPYKMGTPLLTGANAPAISYMVEDHTFTSNADIYSEVFLKSGVFFWEPSIGINSKSKPNVTKIQFGDGYSQRIENGINTQLLTIEAKFNQKSDFDSYCILHFLHEHGGNKSFNFTPPPPYNISGKKWTCSEWNINKTFKNNNDISVTLEEVVEK